MFNYETSIVIDCIEYKLIFERDSLTSEDFDLEHVKFAHFDDESPVEEWKAVKGSEIEEGLELELYETEDPSFYQEVIEGLHPDVNYLWDGRDIYLMEM